MKTKRAERFGSDAQNELEFVFMLDSDRDPARNALALLEMRGVDHPYVIRRRDAWHREVHATLPDASIGSDGMLLRHGLELVLAQANWEPVEMSESDLLAGAMGLGASGLADLERSLREVLLPPSRR